MMAKQTIFTFSGKAQHGKDESAKILKQIIESHGKTALVISYADYLKHLARQYFGWDGNKDEKGRALLQNIGTEKVRTKFPNFWVNIAIGVAQIFEDDYDYVLISDCRYPNEIHRWLEEGYTVISTHVTRLNFVNCLTDNQKNHSSETSLDNFPFSVRLQAETVDALKEEIRHKLERFII